MAHNARLHGDPAHRHRPRRPDLPPANCRPAATGPKLKDAKSGPTRRRRDLGDKAATAPYLTLAAIARSAWAKLKLIVTGHDGGPDPRSLPNH